MKKLLVILMIMSGSISMQAQSQEVQQLLLNVEKLAQLKDILNNMYKGYTVLSKGYTTIKDISQGNFNLHEVFLDNLMKVSPVVRKYNQVAGIVNFQLRIVSEYKKSYKRFKADGNFNEDEIRYIGTVYKNLFDQSLKNLDALINVTTANKLRMSDDERLEAIDTLFADMRDKLSFLRYFNNSTSLLAIQRAKERNDVNTTRNLYGITP